MYMYLRFCVYREKVSIRIRNNCHAAYILFHVCHAKVSVVSTVHLHSKHWKIKVDTETI